MSPKYLDTRELADELDASYQNVLDWTRLGVIPTVKVSGRYYYRLDRVMKAIRAAQRTESATMEAVAC